MRINVYAEELTHDVEVFQKTSDTGRVFFGVRFYFHSSPLLHFKPGDDDRSAVTFWVPWTQKEGHKPGLLVGLFTAAIALLRSRVPATHVIDQAQQVDAKIERSLADKNAELAKLYGASPFPPRYLGFDHGASPGVAADVRGIMPGRDGRGCVSEIKTGRTLPFPSYVDSRFYQEAWQHAACLTIAEGGPDWEKPSHNDSAAMVAVRELRQGYEKQRDQIKALEDVVGSISNTLHRLKA